MFRYAIPALAALALAPAPAARADWDDDWEDYRDRVREFRERERERYEDWLDDQREAREDYLDRLEDERDRQRRWERRLWRRGPFGGSPSFYGPGYAYPAGPGYYAPPVWSGRGWDGDRPGGFFLRGPRGNGFSIRW